MEQPCPGPANSAPANPNRNSKETTMPERPAGENEPTNGPGPIQLEFDFGILTDAQPRSARVPGVRSPTRFAGEAKPTNDVCPVQLEFAFDIPADAPAHPHASISDIASNSAICAAKD
jgi:hypothetical protein